MLRISPTFQLHNCWKKAGSQTSWVGRNYHPSLGMDTNTYGCVWKWLVPHCTQWFLLIIIPFLNGYFIGKINSTFSVTNPYLIIGESINQLAFLGFQMKQLRDTRSHFHFQWSAFLTGEEHRPSKWCETDHAFTEPQHIYCSIRGLKLQRSSHWLCRLKWEMCSSGNDRVRDGNFSETHETRNKKNTQEELKQ